MDHEAIESAAVFSAAFLKEFFSGADKLRKQVQANLHVLAFKHSNSIRGAVSRIAEGNGSLDDLKFIAYRLRVTQNKTEAAYRWIQDNSPKIAQLLNAHYAADLDRIATMKMGGHPDDEGIRAQLRELVAAGSLQPDVAKKLLGQMDEFNALLEQLK